MKRGDVLYPHAFTILAAIAYHGNDASIQEAAKVISIRVPEAQSFHQILRHLNRKGYVDRTEENNREYGHRVRWYVTGEGMTILRKTERYYRFALELCAGRSRGSGGGV